MEEEEDEEASSFDFYPFHGRFTEKNAQVITDEGNIPSKPSADDEFEFTHIGSSEAQIIRPVFPVFNRDLLLPRYSGLYQSDHSKKLNELNQRITLRISSLKKYYSFANESDDEERGPPSSESEADDIHACKRSHSARALASKEWKLSDFFHRRSYSSEGREDSFVFLVPTYNGGQAGETQKGGKQTRRMCWLITKCFAYGRCSERKGRGSRIFRTAKTSLGALPTHTHTGIRSFPLSEKRRKQNGGAWLSLSGQHEC